MTKGALLLAGVLGCEAARVVPAPESPPPPIEVRAAASAIASAAVPAASAPPPDPPPPAKPVYDPHEVALPLRAGGKACTLVFGAQTFEDAPDSFRAMAIGRITTLAGGACAAGVLFDETNAVSAAGDSAVELEGGDFAKKPAIPQPSPWPTNRYEDLDFDGYRDLCVVAFQGGSGNYTQLCWLFDPKTRTFRRNGDLAGLNFVEIRPATRTLVAPPQQFAFYTPGEYAWRGGKLVLVRAAK